MRVAVAVIIALLLYLSGEQHQANCINQGHAGCTVFPWDNGYTASQQTQLQRLQTKYGLNP